MPIDTLRKNFMTSSYYGGQTLNSMQVLMMEGEERIRINYYIPNFLMVGWIFKNKKGGGWNLKNLASLSLLKNLLCIGYKSEIGLREFYSVNVIKLILNNERNIWEACWVVIPTISSFGTPKVATPTILAFSLLLSMLGFLFALDTYALSICINLPRNHASYFSQKACLETNIKSLGQSRY